MALVARGVIGLSAPAAVPLLHEAMRLPLLWGLDPAAEVAVVTPGRPHDARELVGESDGGLVVTAAFLDIERPGAKPIERDGPALSAAGREQYGSGSMDEQGSQVRIALLADASQVSVAIQ